MDWIVVPFVTLVIFTALYKIIELFARRRERVMIIEKITEMSKVKLSSLDLSMGKSRFTSLRGGCLMMGVGLGLFFAFWVLEEATAGKYIFGTYEEMRYFRYEIVGIVYFAFTSLFGGLGLVISYIIESIMNKKSEEKSTN
mgnify:CR=1 FL=1